MRAGGGGIPRAVPLTATLVRTERNLCAFDEFLTWPSKGETRGPTSRLSRTRPFPLRRTCAWTEAAPHSPHPTQPLRRAAPLVDLYALSTPYTHWHTYIHMHIIYIYSFVVLFFSFCQHGRKGANNTAHKQWDGPTHEAPTRAYTHTHTHSVAVLISTYAWQYAWSTLTTARRLASHGLNRWSGGKRGSGGRCRRVTGGAGCGCARSSAAAC